MRDHLAPQPMRILMLINLFLPEVYAGGERQCLRLSRALRDHGVAPTILTSRSDRATPAFEVVEGIPVRRLWCAAQPQKGGRHIGASLAWMRKVNRWIGAHRGEIDLVHCHHAKLNAWVGLRAARRIGVPCLVKIGSAGPNFDFLSLERKRFVYGRLAAREIRDGADGFVATSNEMMRDLLDYGIEGRRLAHIPNGVDMPGPVDGRTVARIRAEARLREGERLVVFAGRMERQKNVETLLKAVAGIAARDLQARVLLLGDGALLDEHRRLAHSIGLDDRVRFAGRVEAIGDYLSAADLFVLPARAEGMSNAVLEAMAHGVPQVVSKVSGNTDLVIAGRTGWHYAPPEDAGALAGVLAEALATPPDRLAAMGEVSRRRVQEAFSIDTVAARHAALYRTLTEREDAYAHVA